MRRIISLRYYYLIAKHAIELGTIILRLLSVGSFVVSQDTSTSLILLWDLDISITVI